MVHTRFTFKLQNLLFGRILTKSVGDISTHFPWTYLFSSSDYIFVVRKMLDVVIIFIISSTAWGGLMWPSDNNTEGSDKDYYQ